MNFLVGCVTFTCILHLINSERRKMEAFVVEGEKAKIESFPHSAYLGLTCEENNLISRWRCGASILNQQLFLTAAHCFDACQRNGEIILSIGHVHRQKGLTVKVEEFRIHPHYKLGKLSYDIALARGRPPLTFNTKVSRVAIMSDPPYLETAYVAGWGFVDEIHQTTTDLLHYTQQQLIDQDYCKKVIRNTLPGTFCALGKGYASLGDSGSALVVRGYIQIGLVSYKNPPRSRRVIVYTDIGHYYNWITTNAKELFCN